MNNEKVFIIGALRTPVGRLLGKLSHLSAPELASIVIKETIKRYGIRGGSVDEVIMGNVLQAGVGQNPARQAAILAGLPYSVSALTVNMVCASGLIAVAAAFNSIRLGEAGVIIAGGMESMSNAPFILREMRTGRRLGDAAVIDSMVHDGLRDCYYDAHMGSLCELAVNKYGISRRKQDEFALESHRKALKATNLGFFRDEVVPVKAMKPDEFVEIDETIRRDTDLKKLSLLKPAFKEGGTITVGNSPGLNDGAACLLIVSGKTARRLSLRPLAEIIAYSTAHVDPKWYTIAPIKSVERILRKTGLNIDDFDLIEENEAFAAQTLAIVKELSLDPKKVNVNGGAIALGHPIGASGARVLTTLVHALKKRRKKLGLATLCLGGGGAVSMAVRGL